MAVPTLDAPLAEWGNQFNVVGTAAPTDFGLVASQMVQFDALYTTFNSAYLAASADGARNKALVVAKDDAKAEFLAFARELYGVVLKSPTTSNENRTLIGVHVPDVVPTPVPAVGLAPGITVKSVAGRVVTGTLKDLSVEGKRRRPINAKGAVVLIAWGPTAPAANEPGWVLQGNSTRTKFVVQFPDEVQPGEPCYITAMWYNERGEYSPASNPITTYLQIGPATSTESA